MTAWDDYLAAARRLDAVRQQAAAVLAERAGAIQAANRELAEVRQRRGIQQARLLDLAHRAGLPPLPMMPVNPVPDPTDPIAAATVLRAARADLDTADAMLAQVDRPDLATGPLADWPPARRNSLVYGGVAVLVLAIQSVLFVTVHNTAAWVFALACGAALPVIGYGLAWLIVGLAFKGRGRVDRTPLLGAALSAVPVLLFCAGIGTFALLH